MKNINNSINYYFLSLFLNSSLKSTNNVQRQKHKFTKLEDIRTKSTINKQAGSWCVHTGVIQRLR